LATVSSDGQVTIWQFDGTKQERLLSSQTADWLGLATDLIFIDEAFLVAVGLADGQVQLWQAAPAIN
jgi:WD40 repeat protein